MSALKGVVGIVGGMGPQATVDLMRKVIEATPAAEESDHVHMLVDCNPQVPNRTDALLGSGPSPAAELERMARGLESAGADFLAMPCNTAHAFLPAIRAAVRVPVLDMIALAVDKARMLATGGTDPAIGLLATRGTRRSRLYHERLTAMRLRAVDLEEAEQDRLDALIKHAKTRTISAREREQTAELIARLAARGALAAVAGCTEVPLLLPADPAVPVVDATQVLAEAIVATSLGSSVGSDRAGSPAA